MKINGTPYLHDRIRQDPTLKTFDYNFVESSNITIFELIHSQVHLWESGTTYQCCFQDEERYEVCSNTGTLLVVPILSEVGPSSTGLQSDPSNGGSG